MADIERRAGTRSLRFSSSRSRLHFLKKGGARVGWGLEPGGVEERASRADGGAEWLGTKRQAIPSSAGMPAHADPPQPAEMAVAGAATLDTNLLPGRGTPSRVGTGGDTFLLLTWMLRFFMTVSTVACFVPCPPPTWATLASGRPGSLAGGRGLFLQPGLHIGEDRGHRGLGPRMMMPWDGGRSLGRLGVRLRGLRHPGTQADQDRLEEEEARSLVSWPTGGFVPQVHVKVERFSMDTAELGSRSRVFVNDTQRPAVRSGLVPLSTKWEGPQDDASMHFTMLGEFYSERPGYLHLHPPLRNGELSRLWITDFGMVGNGGIVGIDVSGRRQACVCEAPFLWPNDVQYVASGTWDNVADAGILVADGFLVPGKTDGGVYFVVNPGTESEEVAKLTSDKKQFFYHKAVPFEIDGRQGVLTARACKPIVPFAKAEGELVWLEKPETLSPTAPWSVPWREVVVAKGPDVMFDVADLDPSDGTVQVFAAEFFAKRLTVTSLRWDEQIRAPKAVDTQVIDDNLGQAYSVVVADLSGKNSHILVTTHEDSRVEEKESSTGSLFRLSSMNTRWTYTKTPTPKDSRTLGGLAVGDESVESLGGMMLAYKIPDNWRPEEILTEEKTLRERLPSLFKNMDRRGAGRLSLNELIQSLRSVGVKTTKEQVKELFAQADWEGSGEIDYFEFETVMMEAFKADKKNGGQDVLSAWTTALKALDDKRDQFDHAAFRKGIPAMFKKMDVDGSGQIDMTEMKIAMDAMGVSCTDVELAAMFVEADWDGDGTIDYEEFSNLMESFYAGTRSPENLWMKAISAFETALRQTTLLKEDVVWERLTLACGFRVKRLGINPGAPGFAYPFYPHKRMKELGHPPHILLSGDCADAAYVFRPVPDSQGKVHYELMATFGFEGTVGSIAIGYCDTVDSVDDGWAKFFLGVYETDRVYMFKCGGMPIKGVVEDW